jgi:hypothetical protein
MMRDWLLVYSAATTRLSLGTHWVWIAAGCTISYRLPRPCSSTDDNATRSAVQNGQVSGSGMASVV